MDDGESNGEHETAPEPEMDCEELEQAKTRKTELQSAMSTNLRETMEASGQSSEIMLSCGGIDWYPRLSSSFRRHKYGEAAGFLLSELWRVHMYSMSKLWDSGGRHR
eukprot:5456372-Amphidinium_carterae.1